MMSLKKTGPIVWAILCSICLGLNLSSSAQLSNWGAVLPGRFPVNVSGQINGISRVSQFKFHPNNPNKMYAISAQGGLFISNDAGNNWSVAPGCDFMAGNRLASVCVDFSNDSIIYLGTGDHDYYYNGTGVWKSVNGGRTFTQTALNSQMIIEMIMDPHNDSVIVACTNKGIYKTYNAGTTWLAKTATTIAFDDMKQVASPLSRTLFAATNDSSLYRSTDFGETWVQITQGIRVPAGYTSGDGCRIAVTAADTSVIYFAMVANGGTVFRSANGGNSFTAVKNTAPPFLTYYDDTVTSSTQGDYNFNIGADNHNPNILYMVAHCVWRSLDGGVTWSQLSHWYAGVHTDMHQITLNPYNPAQVFTSNDGGVWLSTDTGTNWTPKSDGIYGYEVYHGNCSPTRQDMISIGTQDNGELYGTSTGWYTNRGGDWSPQCAFDYRPNSSMVYYFDGNERRLVTGGTENYGLDVTELQDIGFNRRNPDLAFAADTAIYRTTNLLSEPPTWTQIANWNKIIKAVHSSVADTNKLFIATNEGHLYVSNNATAATPTFTVHTLPNTTSNEATITTIKNKPGVVYITCNTRVFRSADTGTTWTNITYNLPNVNHVRIIADEFYPDSETVFIASYNTVYYKTRSQTTWTQFNAQLPSRTSLNDMSVYEDSSANAMLRVSAYGRGMWQSSIGATRPLKAIMSVDAQTACVGLPVAFSDISNGAVVARKWLFPGGSPSTSTAQNPVITYSAFGTFPVTLTVYSASDSSTVTHTAYISVTPGNNLNVAEGFQETFFPPTGWGLKDNNNDGYAWQQYPAGGAYGASTQCMYFDNYNNNAGGSTNDIVTARYDLNGYTNIQMTFDRAYRVYTDPNEIDSFAILISIDCGATFNEIYRKGGTQLATVSTQGSYTQPGNSDWRADTINLSSYSGQSAIFAFRNIGHYGNMLFIDNINIRATLNSAPKIIKNICAGSSVQLGSTSVSEIKYRWLPATGLNSDTISNPVATPNVNTTYILTSTQIYSNITAKDTVVVNVNHLQLSTTATDSVCNATSSGIINTNTTLGTGNYSYHWSNGTSAAVANNLIAGIYSVTVRDITGGCSLTATDTICSYPAIIYTASADTIPCSSTGGFVSVTATGGEGTLHYAWNTGDTTSAVTNLSTGNYIATITDGKGCRVQAFVAVTQEGTPPSLSINTPDTLSCKKQSIVLTATSSAGISLQWNNGISGNTDTITATGYYNVIATDTLTGCKTTDTALVTEQTLIGSILITADRSLLCPSDSAQLCAPAGYHHYLWNRGDTTTCISTTQQAEYFINVHDSTGCLDTSNHIFIITAVQPVATVQIKGDTLYTGPNFSTYQWQHNGANISGATNSIYVTGISGSYSVAVSDSNGCSAVSNTFVISGIDNVITDRFEVYPNPTLSLWTVDVGEKWIGSLLELTDATGKLIYKTRISETKTILQPALASGVYFIKISSGTNSLVKKSVKM